MLAEKDFFTRFIVLNHDIKRKKESEIISFMIVTQELYENS